MGRIFDFSIFGVCAAEWIESHFEVGFDLSMMPIFLDLKTCVRS